MRSSFGSKSSWDNDISDSFKLGRSLLDDDDVKDRKVSTDDATSDGLSLALAVFAGAMETAGLYHKMKNKCVIK